MRVRARMSIRPITRRQAAFAKAFVRTGGNQTRAAIEAGYSPKNQHAYGNRLLKNDAVLAAVMAEIASGAPGADAALRRLQLACRSHEIRLRAEVLRKGETAAAKIIGDDRPLVVIDEDAAALRNLRIHRYTDLGDAVDSGDKLDRLRLHLFFYGTRGRREHYSE